MPHPRGHQRNSRNCLRRRGRLANKGRMAETIPAWVERPPRPGRQARGAPPRPRHPAVSVFLWTARGRCSSSARPRQVPQPRPLGERLLHPPALGRGPRRLRRPPPARGARRRGRSPSRRRGRIALRAPRSAAGSSSTRRSTLFAAAADARLPARPRPRRGDGDPLDRPRRAAGRDRRAPRGLHALAPHLPRRPRRPALRPGRLTVPERDLARLLAGLAPRLDPDALGLRHPSRAAARAASRR